MIRALLLCLIATPCLADRYEWGGPDPSVVETYPGEGMGHVATVTFHNTLTYPIIGRVSVPLTEGGVSLAVTVGQRPGDDLDRLTVTPPEGYIAIPAFIDVEEDASGSVEIFEADGVPVS